MFVQTFRKAILVPDAQPPYDRIHLKIFYPVGSSQTENLFSSIPADKDSAPFPVIIFFNGFGCSSSVYQWLAISLAKRGLVIVLFDWLIKTNQNVSITPGIDIAAFSEENYGKVPSASAFNLLLDELHILQSTGILAGLLDLQTIILGGHSVGGRLALHNTNPRFCVGDHIKTRLAGAFSYAGHTAAPSNIGKEPGSVLPLPDSLPMLLLGGTQDGVIASTSKIYGVENWSTPAEPIVRTFRTAFDSDRGDSYLIIFEGANHFTIANPADSTIRVTEKDFVATCSEAEVRSLMASAIGLFIDSCIRHKFADTEKLQQLLETNSSAIALSEVK